MIFTINLRVQPGKLFALQAENPMSEPASNLPADAMAQLKARLKN
jgi:hypothetical protein